MANHNIEITELAVGTPHVMRLFQSDDAYTSEINSK